MKFSIAGVVYDAADLDLVSLRDILIFETETAEMGRPFYWSEIEEIGNRIAHLPDDEKSTDRGVIWLTAVTVWAARRAKGEAVTFAQAVDFPMRDFLVVAEPQDRPAKAKANPTKAARPVSGRAAKRVLTTTSGSNSAETSEEKSIDD